MDYLGSLILETDIELIEYKSVYLELKKTYLEVIHWLKKK